MPSVLPGGNETSVDQRGTIELLADQQEPAMLLLEMAGVGRERRMHAELRLLSRSRSLTME